jgi:Na+/H+ antiporter NhaD/arsenite permease-like protein
MEQLTLATPFAGILASFALGPAFAPRLWHRWMPAIILFWVGLNICLETGVLGIAAAVLSLWQVTVTQFLPFIMLLLALYAMGGGIAITGGPWGRPSGNLLLLVIGTVLASVMGTIGASLLLIHPLLAANGHRFEKRHLVIAFIILVGNCGGALSPLGDPPLLVGFLRGVPFFWPVAHLAVPTLVLIIPVLALCFGLDVYFSRREAKTAPKNLKIRGLFNIGLLVVLTLAIPVAGIWQPGLINILGAVIPGQQAALTLLATAGIIASEVFTARSIRRHNRFAWTAMREIVLLFFAIFATIDPVFALLKQAALPEHEIGLWFWASGIASAILDAAPTYLIFFQAAGGHAATLIVPPGKLLAALSAGSVFFGPITYLGNAPNLMIREIAARRGVRMPGFFAYAAIMSVILMPIYLLMTILFF